MEAWLRGLEKSLLRSLSCIDDSCCVSSSAVQLPVREQMLLVVLASAFAAFQPVQVFAPLGEYSSSQHVRSSHVEGFAWS